MMKNDKDNHTKSHNHVEEYYHINSNLTKEIFPIDVGYEKHVEEKTFSNKYPYYLIHFVKSGEGHIEIDNVDTVMTKNTIFILPPQKKITYTIKKNKEWEYYWINFNGTAIKTILKNLGFTDKKYYVKMPDKTTIKYFVEALKEKNRNIQSLCVTHCLFAIFSEIARHVECVALTKVNDKTFTESIMDYIYDHIYDSNLTAQQIADNFYISPCYFSTVFKKISNVSFKEFVNYEKIKKATELIESSEMTIKEIAISVGFNDPLYFSRVFKKYRLYSPQQYKNILKK